MTAAALTATWARWPPTGEAAESAAHLADRGWASPAMALAHALESGDVAEIMDHDPAAIEQAASLLLSATGWRIDDVREMHELLREFAYQTGDEHTVVEGAA